MHDSQKIGAAQLKGASRYRVPVELTQGTNNFSRPSVPGTGFNRAFYLSNGYAVLEPDIKYYINDPGMSAVWAIVPAVKAAIAVSMSVAECAADIWVRMRAWPLGTTGKEKPIT